MSGITFHGEKPDDRLYRLGPQALRDIEILAICVRDSSKAEYILDKHSKESLVDMDLSKIMKLGVPKSKAQVLVAAFELARRGLGKGLGIKPAITSPSDGVAQLQGIADHQREHFVCLYLNARNQVIHKEVVSIGSLSAAIVHPREVFREGVVRSAASVILAHNHPSGDVSPSQDDINLTRRLVQAGEIMGIDVLDHLIIGSDDFLSMKERGLMS